MIDALNSRRMTIVIVILIIVCTIIVIIEEWITNSQPAISSSPSQKAIISADIDIGEQRSELNQTNLTNIINNSQQQIQRPPLPDRQIDSDSSIDLQKAVAGSVQGSQQDLLLAKRKCWTNESYDIVKPCSLCSTYELETSHSRYHSNVHLCSKTGYKELIECSKSGLVERACYTNWRRFIISFCLFALFGGICGLLTKFKQYQNSSKILERFRKPSTPSSRDSPESHTLIDMNHRHWHEFSTKFEDHIAKCT